MFCRSQYNEQVYDVSYLRIEDSYVPAITVCSQHLISALKSFNVNFNESGFELLNLGADGSISAITTTSDGRILAVGSVNLYFLVLLLNKDGSLNDNFASNGVKIFNIGSYDYFTDIVYYKNKIFTCGITDQKAILCCFNIYGELDQTFGTNGIILGDANTTFNKIKIFNNKIIVCGSSLDQVLISRYDLSGNLDTSFGPEGKVLSSFSDNNDIGYSIVIQSDAKIIVAISQEANDRYIDFSLIRYNWNGTIDTTFGTSGKTTIDFGTEDSNPSDLLINNDNSIIVGGAAGTEYFETSSIVLVKLSTSGSIDPSFGINGIVTQTFDDYSLINSMAFQNNKILIGGVSGNSQNYSSLLVRYDSDGNIDTTFGSNGSVIEDIGNSQINGLCVKNRNIIAGGLSYSDPDQQILILNYLPNGNKNSI